MSEKMDPELKARWIAALRSGEYRQGAYCLKQESSEEVCYYCCLGVLGEVGEFEGNTYLLEGADGDSTVPGLSMVQQGFLSRLNDEGRWNFDWIADFIEAFL